MSLFRWSHSVHSDKRIDYPVLSWLSGLREGTGSGCTKACSCGLSPCCWSGNCNRDAKCENSIFDPSAYCASDMRRPASNFDNVHSHRKGTSMSQSGAWVFRVQSSISEHTLLFSSGLAAATIARVNSRTASHEKSLACLLRMRLPKNRPTAHKQIQRRAVSDDVYDAPQCCFPPRHKLTQGSWSCARVAKPCPFLVPGQRFPP